MGFEREIAPEIALKITFIRRDYRQQLQDHDLNHSFRRDEKGRFIDTIGAIVTGSGPGGGQPTTSSDSRPDLYINNYYFNQIMKVGNFNEARYRGIEVELVRRLSRRWQFEASYTYSRAIGAAETFQSALGNDPTIEQDEFGYLDYDQRHVVKLNAATYLPGDWQLGTVMNWSTGLPYSIADSFVSFDNADYAQYRTFYGYFDPITKKFVFLHRNTERNRAFLNIDVRAQKALVIGRMDSKIFLSVENLLNRDDLRITRLEMKNDDSRDGGVTVGQVRRFGRRFEVGFQFNF